MLFSRASLVLALSLAAFVSAHPHEKRWENPWGGSWPGGSWGGGDDHHKEQPSRTRSPMDLIKRGDIFAARHCNLTKAIPKMNLNAVSPPLPSPNPGYSLFQIAIGRGTQNYTCDLANATATPVPVGALATLFDVSCAVNEFEPLYKVMTQVALDLPDPSVDDTSGFIMKNYMSGHHYFLDDTTPFFNLDTPFHEYGTGAMAKANASDAPANAYAGPGNAGAVQWLKLDMSTSDAGAWKEVYRLNTAGGNPPKKCTGMQASFEVQYSAAYWIFK